MTDECSNADSLNPGSNDSLDNWELERLYNRLFAELIEKRSATATWRYDPLDSKYPTIDGILRREMRLMATYANGKHLEPLNHEDFVLVQLKGSRDKGDANAAFKKLRKLLNTASMSIEEISLSASALLIGLIIDEGAGPGHPSRTPKILKAYLAAPKASLSAAKVKRYSPIEPEHLREMIDNILDARQGLFDRHAKPHRAGSEVDDLTVRPRPEETFFFNKGPQGRYSIENGLFVGQDISINWTIPRFARIVTITKINGFPEVEAIPAKLPHPPYREISGNRQRIIKIWKPPLASPTMDVYWILQIRFRKEAALKVVAGASPPS